MFRRTLHLPAPGMETFFLWGPRQTGKTTLLRQTYADAFWIDLLKAEEYRRYLQNLERLREELTTRPALRVAIEAKATRKVTADHLRGLRNLAQDHPRVGQRVVVCLESRNRETEDGILITPAREFCERLCAGDF